jgi:two-component system response regulator RegA
LTKPADADQIVAALQHGASDSPAPPGEPLSLARAEWEHINHVLVSVSGNISEAARRLGLHRRSLQRKLAKYPPTR